MLLELRIAEEFRAERLTKLDAADWLRLVFDAQRELPISNAIIHQTRLADVLPPEPSPFSPKAMSDRRRVDYWRIALQAWIQRAGPETSRAEWQTGILLSAVLHGALVDVAKMNGLLDRVRNSEWPTVASGFAQYDFALPFQGLGNLHLQRWWPDPITELLILRTPTAGANLKTKQLRGAIVRLLKTHGVTAERWPKGLSDLVQGAATWWSERTAQIDVQGMRRKFAAHSIHARTWSRFHGIPQPPRPVRERGARGDSAGIAADEDAGLLDDAVLLHPWLAEASELLNKGDTDSARDDIARLLADNGGNPLAATYLGWLEFMLAGNSSTRDALALSTVRRWFSATVPRLLLVLGDDNPSSLSTEELEDYYAELAGECDPAAPIRDIKFGLREFHAYLVLRHRKTHMQSLAKVLGDDAGLLPVDANLINFDDYIGAREWFDQRLADGGDPDDVDVCKLVMAFAFRLGMRRMEILGLRLNDLHLVRGMVCLVRPHSERRLKTRSSKRLVPMHAFLDWRERKLLRAWLARRLREEKGLPPHSDFSPYLFALYDKGIRQVSVEGVTDRICEAIRSVTGDDNLFLHHLRHAFGTWTYLRLRAPDYPMIADHFDHLPETARAIRSGTRLRRLLLGRNESPSRVYVFAVARLLGHFGPAVSIAHYIHGNDLVLAAIVHREIAEVPASILVSASGMSRANAYAHLKVSAHQLAATAREQHRSNQAILADLVPSTPETKPVGRPRNPLPHTREPWLPLAKVRAVLHLFDEANRSIEEIAKQLRLDLDRIEKILCNAWRFGASLGLTRDANLLVRCPGKMRYAGEVALASELEQRLAALAVRAPRIYLDGLDLHLNHFNRQKHDVAFKGSKERIALERYLRFLASLGIDCTRVQWVVRQQSSADLPTWAAKLDASWLPSRLKRIAPPTQTKAGSYAQWLGVQIVDDAGDGLGMAMATTLFLARVAVVRTKVVSARVSMQVRLVNGEGLDSSPQ